MKRQSIIDLQQVKSSREDEKVRRQDGEVVRINYKNVSEAGTREAAGRGRKGQNENDRPSGEGRFYSGMPVYDLINAI